MVGRPYLFPPPPIVLHSDDPLDLLGSGAYQVGPSEAWTRVGGYAPSWAMEASGHGRWRVYDVTHGEELLSGPYWPGRMTVGWPLSLKVAAVVEVQVLGAAVRVAGLL